MIPEADFVLEEIGAFELIDLALPVAAVLAAVTRNRSPRSCR